MTPVDSQGSRPDAPDGEPAIHCEACQSAVNADGGHDLSYLLLDRLTIPVLSCADHSEEFAAVCALTTDDAATLLDHRPAGGVQCPACRKAPYATEQPMVPVEDGALVVLACPEHQAEVVQRYQTGLETREQLTATLDTATDSPL